MRPDAPRSQAGDRTLRRLVAVLAVIAVVAALKATKAVTMPLAFALFLVVLFWPLHRRLAARLPHGIALLLTFLAFLAVLAAFSGAVWLAADEVAEGAAQYEQEIQSLRAQAEAWLGAEGGGNDEGEGWAAQVAQRVAAATWSALGYLVLIGALFVLAMGEVRGWKEKLRTHLDDPVSTELIDTAEQVARQVQQFLLVQSFTAVVTGVLAGLICWIVGVDFALLWGLLTLLLNFIPTLGSVVAVALPTLFALLQFGLGGQVAALFLALTTTELVLGAYVDPKLQGRYLELSAFVIVVAIAFWGWVWGIPGAFIATPVTAALVLAARHGAGTEWVARLLTRADSEAT